MQLRRVCTNLNIIQPSASLDIAIKMSHVKNRTLDLLLIRTATAQGLEDHTYNLFESFSLHLQDVGMWDE